MEAAAKAKAKAEEAEAAAAVRADTHGPRTWTRAEIESLRAEAFADDVVISPAMCEWTHAQLVAHFESGGTVVPVSTSEAISETISVSISETTSEAISVSAVPPAPVPAPVPPPPVPSADLETRRDLETISVPSADFEALLAKAREEAREEAAAAAAAAAQVIARQTMEVQSQMLALIAEQHAMLLKAVGESTSKLSQRLDSLEEAPSRAPGTTPATPAAPSEALPWALGDRSVSVAEAAPGTVSDGSGGGGGEGGGGGGRSRGDGGGRSGSTAADVHPVWSDIFMPDDAR